MSDPIYNIISSAIVLLAAIAGFVFSFLQQKWKQKQVRVDAMIEKRMTAYGEGLQFVYEIEQNQTKEEELNQIIERWTKWYPRNAVYLPPSVNDALFEAVRWTVPVTIDLHNDGKVEREIWTTFKEKLQKAKESLMKLEEIGWLPKDLK